MDGSTAVPMQAFEYELLSSAIAQVPAEPRDSARLLVDRGATTPPNHLRVSDLPLLLHEGDLLVVNDTRVIPARLRVRRETGGNVEVFLVRPLEGGGWHALVRPARRLGVGEVLRSVHPAGDEFAVEIGEPLDDTGGRRVRLLADDQVAALDRHGTMPLPPYIHTPLHDPERYQTVYADRPGSVAAPTAGLHLTPGLLQRCRASGIRVCTVELVVGLDTFRPVVADRPEDHVIHREEYRVPAETLDECAAAKRVVAVGTTTVRALESAARGPLSGDTALFIHGGFDWQVVDLLLTNFHLPRSSLLLLVDAFIGPRWRTLYEVALREQYRFLSFGDAMLLDRHAPR
jgi:S-adenosylmethionine:tRNA ribosyltransferase-isomerase